MIVYVDEGNGEVCHRPHLTLGGGSSRRHGQAVPPAPTRQFRAWLKSLQGTPSDPERGRQAEGANKGLVPPPHRREETINPVLQDYLEGR